MRDRGEHDGGAGRGRPPDGRAFSERVPTISAADRGETPVCQVDGCDREGVAPRKFRFGDDPDEPVIERYVCVRHRRLFLAVKAGIVLLGVLALLIAFFHW